MRGWSGFFQEDVGIVVIDYLGLVDSYGRESSYERVSRLSREMKAFAKDQQVGLIVLQQLSREARSGGEPVSLRMCRDSGVFEESCDYLLGAWRPELSETATIEEKISNRGLIKVAILKNRCGGNRIVDLWLNSDNLRIEEQD